MSKKRKHLTLTPKEVELSQLFFEWAEIWYTDEKTHEESNKRYRDFLKKHRKVKQRLNPETARKLLNAYSNFCDVVRELSDAKKVQRDFAEKMNEIYGVQDNSNQKKP